MGRGLHTEELVTQRGIRNAVRIGQVDVVARKLSFEPSEETRYYRGGNAVSMANLSFSIGSESPMKKVSTREIRTSRGKKKMRHPFKEVRSFSQDIKKRMSPGLERQVERLEK